MKLMRIVLLVLMTVWSQSIFAQRVRLLDRHINHPAYNSVYPAVSGDGKVMLYMSDYSDDGSFTLMKSDYRAGKWQIGEDVEGVGSSKVNNWGGYALDYDGKSIYFSSRRSNGVGGFDIWFTKEINGKWSRADNIGKPLNTSANEGNPSITPDNQRIYFMRCDRMSTSIAEGCKIFYSEKGPRGWQEAVELPDYINRGNTTSPRILPDNRTLLFASDRPGGKGGIDIWLTKRSGDHWSEPINVEAVNTSGDDLFLTTSLRSIAYFTTVTDEGKKAIAELRLPENLRLQNVIIKQGAVRDEFGKPLAAEVRAYDLDEEFYETRIRTSVTDGKFIMILPEGTTYDVSYNEIRLNKLYKSEFVDATELVAPRREYPNIVLPDLTASLIFPLNVFSFKPHTSEIDTKSTLELSRLKRMLKRYPNLSIEIGAYQKEYLEEPNPTTEDLSEVRIDTLITYEHALRVDTMQNHHKDSLLIVINTKLASTFDEDTTHANVLHARMASIDSVAVTRFVNVYHNNRTPAQADAVKANLVEDGIEESRLHSIGYRDETPPVDFQQDKERMIVIRFLSDPKSN